jgi:hypothetical protein
MQGTVEPVAGPKPVPPMTAGGWEKRGSSRAGRRCQRVLQVAFRFFWWKSGRLAGFAGVIFSYVQHARAEHNRNDSCLCSVCEVVALGLLLQVNCCAGRAILFPNSCNFDFRYPLSLLQLK